MVEIGFQYEDKRDPIRIDGNEAFPIHLVADVADGSISSMTLRGEIHQDGQNQHFGLISRLLENIPKKLDQIGIGHIDEVSPEYLVFFVSLLNKTKKLIFYQGLDPNGASVACLKAGLLRPDGIRELRITHCRDNRILSAHQMRLLFEGIASSPSLESLRLEVEFQPDDSIPNDFVSALRQTENLKSLVFVNRELVPQANLVEFLEAAIVDARIQDLRFIAQPGSLYELSIMDLKRLLCRKECRLETLYWAGTCILCPAEDAEKYPTKCEANKTVKKLAICDCYCSDTFVPDGTRYSMEGARVVGKMISLFQSLKILEFRTIWSETDILGDMLVQDMLVRDNCTIKKLKLLQHDFDDGDFKAFCARLPNMKSLVSLDVKWNSFLASETHMTSLTNGIIRSQKLEAVNLERDIKFEEDVQQTDLDRWQKRWYDVIGVHLALNRAGLHRVRGGDTRNEFPLNLWPLVLNRADTITYDGCEDGPSFQADAIFGLLRENMDVILGRGE